ncbi:hypothetical protein FJW06_05125 [Mesorhizobium sp. B4-1-3]|uniref:hypothetical protein n=1 Tax=Mesorhizobium sp. B4-1-3 TaxID=2589889 RepID=UPI00112E3500|nr:hypothetical protein [Mesorhizobium sp. B4-1-3]TPI15716.1 hypothetical protein FJW06_05125 [Mesorhizobium sp. B4-1-3]
MDARQRSPSYPSTPLDEAIDLVRKIHLIERTNSVERGVAAKAMGYSGISGRSATVLSNLAQYGLLEKTGKNEVRVTRRAVDILYPDSDESKALALHEAANEPDLFSAISERFPDGRPSEAAIESYLIRQGYTHAAVRPATRAYLETFLFLENATGSESYSQPRQPRPVVAESQTNQNVERGQAMAAPVYSPIRSDASPLTPAKLPVPFGVQIKEDMIWLEGVIRNRAEAERVIKAINGLKEMLPEPDAVPATAIAPAESSKDDWDT